MQLREIPGGEAGKFAMLDICVLSKINLLTLRKIYSVSTIEEERIKGGALVCFTACTLLLVAGAKTSVANCIDRVYCCFPLLLSARYPS